jgi:hypothetical protein
MNWRRRRRSRLRWSNGGGANGFRFGRGDLRRFRGRFLLREAEEVLAHQLRIFDVERARVGLLLLDADLGQVVDQHLGLDLKLSRQLVDTDLIDV